MWDLRIMSGKPSKIWWALPGGKTCERGEKEPWLTWLTWRLKMFKSHYWHLLAVSSSGKRPICSIQLTERVTFQDWQGNYDEDRMKWLKISVLERNAWGLFWTPLDTVFSTQEGAYSEGKPKAAMALWHRSISPFNLRIQSEIEELRRAVTRGLQRWW